MFRSILFFLITAFCLPVLAKDWEVFVLFAGADMTEDYQADIDQNVLELARAEIGPGLRLKILREFKDRLVVFQPNPKGPLKIWDSLFQSPPVKGIQVGGTWKERSLQGRIWRSSVLKEELSSFYSADSYRMLVVYGHGEGAKGLRSIGTKDLRNVLENALPSRSNEAPLDILWMDACFMANLEAAYEFRHLSPYYVSSQEAEFSSGMPFDDLDLVVNQEPLKVAQHLALKFIESYSVLKNGSQSRAVEKSSATISVIETAQLERWSPELKRDAEKLRSEQERNPSLWNRRALAIRMENSSLVDVGGLLRWISTPSSELLEIKDQRDLRTTPRVTVSNVKGGTQVVFAFDGWTRGAKDDPLLRNLPSRMEPRGFFTYKGRSFPMRPLKKKITLNPFTVGTKEFDWMIVDDKGRIQAGPFRVRRTRDISYRAAERRDNPIAFFASTHGVGSSSEKYSGLNVTSPFEVLPSLDYVDLDFVLTTSWIQ